MPVNLAHRAYQLFWEVLDWIYPPSCGGCSAWGVRWCAECDRKTTNIEPPLCPICGNPNLTTELCLRCQSDRPFYTCLRSYTTFNGSMREAIHRYKYQHDIGLGERLARMMASGIKKLNWSLDLITCVPLGLVRFKERGYNQATLLAFPTALSLKIPFSARALARIRETRSQVELSVIERQQNMEGAFKAESKLVNGRTVLVIDDVATSGATLNACAKALLDVGASGVYAYTLARAVLSTDGIVDFT